MVRLAKGWGCDREKRVSPFRVIARRIAPKQPRGTSAEVRVRPLGCFARNDAVEAGSERAVFRLSERVWVPAFAGNAGECNKAPIGEAGVGGTVAGVRLASPLYKGPMTALIRFLMNMDARAWRSVGVSFLLFGGVGIVFVFGAQLLGFNGETTVEHWLDIAPHGPFALPVAVAVFALMAFLGVPQFVLIAATVLAFGPWVGLTYSWIGTLVSAVVGFGLGRKIGGGALSALGSVGGGEGVTRFMGLIGRNGFMASLIVRLVPSAPFIVVNMAAGVTPMRFSHFLAGTAIGIIPKIALTAFAGNSIVQAMKGGGYQPVILLILAALVWLGAGFVARRWMKRDGNEISPIDRTK